MGTRTTLTVGRTTAEQVIQDILKGRLSKTCLSEILQACSDETTHVGAYNFTVVEEAGEDDAFVKDALPKSR